MLFALYYNLITFDPMNRDKIIFALPALPADRGECLPVTVIYDLIEGPRLRDGYLCLVTIVERSGEYYELEHDLKEAIENIEGLRIEEFKIY